MNIIPYPSHNFNDRKFLSPDMIIIHYTGMKTANDALNRMTERCDPQVSAHYFITREGIVYQLVDEKHRAWHAGVSSWEGITDINSRSIGIELENKGEEFGYQSFPKKQIDCLIYLLTSIRSRYDIDDKNIIGHSDVAPLRKKDPGFLFPWEYLAQKRHSISPSLLKTMLYSENKKIFFSNLSEWGYRCDRCSYFSPLNRAVYFNFLRKIGMLNARLTQY